MQDRPRYADVVAEVHRFLVERADQARRAGVTEVWVDPGIGFGKTDDHNLSLLHHLPDLVGSGLPVVVGTSRKGFLGRIAPGPDGQAAPLEDRLPASLATATHALACGVRMVRVHDVAATVQAARLVGAIADGESGRPLSTAGSAS
jgi:dihydropteroate synthase